MQKESKTLQTDYVNQEERVNKQTSSSGSGKFSLSNKKIVLIVTAIIGLLLLGLAAFYAVERLREDESVVFTLDGESYTEEDIAPYINSAEGFDLSHEEVVDSIIDYMKLKTAAEKHQVEIKEEDIRQALEQTRYDSLARGEEDLNPWFELVGFRMTMNDYIEQQSNREKQGYAFVFYYGKLKSPRPFVPEPANFGNEDLIQRDQDYAQRKAEEYKQALESGSMEPEEVLEEVSSDERFDPYDAGGSYSTSFGYNDEESWDEQIGLPSVVEFTEGYETVEKVSDIQTGYETRSESVNIQDAEAEDLLDTYYFFVYLTASNQGNDIKQTIESIEVDVR